MNWYDDPNNFPALIQVTGSSTEFNGKLFIVYSYNGEDRLRDAAYDFICYVSDCIFINSIANVAPEALI